MSKPGSIIFAFASTLRAGLASLFPRIHVSRSVDDLVAELAFGEGVSPVLECPFRIFHDVALMDQVHAFAFIFQ